MNDSHINKVKDAVHSMFENNPYEATQIAIGCKQSKGQFSEEKCIRFGVPRKLDPSEISSEKLIPSKLIIDGVEYKTDVYTVPKEVKILSLLCPIETTDLPPPEPVEIYRAGVPVVGTFNSASLKTYLSDEEYGLKCRYWLYTNSNVTSVSITFLKCRDYTFTTTIPNIWATFYTLCPVSSSGAPYTPPDFPNMTKEPDTGPGAYTEDYVCCSDSGQLAVYPNQNESPRITPNRRKQRPLRGGVSMQSPPPTGNYSAGTLGGIVVDLIDGKMVGLTNNHVCANPGGSVNRCQFLASGVHAADDTSFRTINNYQPSSMDSAIINNASDFVGITKRAYPLVTGSINYIDAGIVNLSSSFLDTNSWNAISSSFVSAPPFASTAEIDALTTSNEIFKSGRTTGATNFDFYDDQSENTNKCNIRITNTSTSLFVSGYVGATPSKSITFADTLQIESPYPNNTIAGQGGDSGSIVYAKIGGVWKIVGLFFAGNGIQGYACRIDRVASLLKVGAYTGEAVNADPPAASYLTLDLATYGNQVSASIGGKTYWQIGLNQ